jgi:hypothetical protein
MLFNSRPWLSAHFMFGCGLLKISGSFEFGVRRWNRKSFYLHVLVFLVPLWRNCLTISYLVIYRFLFFLFEIWRRYGRNMIGLKWLPLYQWVMLTLNDFRFHRRTPNSKEPLIFNRPHPNIKCALSHGRELNHMIWKFCPWNRKVIFYMFERRTGHTSV